MRMPRPLFAFGGRQNSKRRMKFSYCLAVARLPPLPFPGWQASTPPSSTTYVFVAPTQPARSFPLKIETTPSASGFAPNATVAAARASDDNSNFLMSIPFRIDDNAASIA